MTNSFPLGFWQGALSMGGDVDPPDDLAITVSGDMPVDGVPITGSVNLSAIVTGGSETCTWQLFGTNGTIYPAGLNCEFTSYDTDVVGTTATVRAAHSDDSGVYDEYVITIAEYSAPVPPQSDWILPHSMVFRNPLLIRIVNNSGTTATLGSSSTPSDFTLPNGFGIRYNYSLLPSSIAPYSYVDVDITDGAAGIFGNDGTGGVGATFAFAGSFPIDINVNGSAASLSASINLTGEVILSGGSPSYSPSNVIGIVNLF